LDQVKNKDTGDENVINVKQINDLVKTG